MNMKNKPIMKKRALCFLSILLISSSAYCNLKMPECPPGASMSACTSHNTQKSCLDSYAYVREDKTVQPNEVTFVRCQWDSDLSSGKEWCDEEKNVVVTCPESGPDSTIKTKEKALKQKNLPKTNLPKKSHGPQ